MKFILSVLTAAAVAVLCRPAFAADYVVDQNHPAADDTGSGAPDNPFKTISRAVRSLVAGDTVSIRTGIYRETVVVTSSGEADKPIVIQAEVGAQPMLTGADVLSGMKPDANGRCSIPWPHRFPVHPNNPRHALIGRCEQVMADRYPLQQVTEPNAVRPGTFCAEKGLLTLQLPFGVDKKSTPVIEASVRTEVLRVTGSHVAIRGLRFRHAANRAQQGMAVFAGANGVIEDCIFERANSVGASFRSEGIQVRRCSFLENGQLGFSANRAHHLLVTECVVRGNNTKNFFRGWEAGGNKLVLCRGVVIERSQFVENRGVGVWFDIGNEACTVRHCLLADNEDAGLFYEISFGLHAHDNVLVGNGLVAGKGSWGADGGIALSSSPDCVIERNLFVGNKDGFQFREQPRTTSLIKGGPPVAVWNHDQVIRHNFYAYNQLQVGGYFDIKDERHWPAAGQTGKTEGARASEDLAAGYQAGDNQGQPVGLSLEKLNLTMADNLFAQRPGQRSLRWGVPWNRNTVYTDPAKVADELPGLERGSRIVDAPFANAAARDFRLPAAHPALVNGCYPIGEVPGVRLGGF